ncbi:hypothetical protein cypCar_00031430 [Cyprinus carpio]|nr:hypothetical protein cypCar_00031430 [Cyprinus carpio]
MMNNMIKIKCHVFGKKTITKFPFPKVPLPYCKMAGYWAITRGSTRRKLLCPTESHQIDVKGPVFLRVQSYPSERHESRSVSFTEEQAHWQIPMNEIPFMWPHVTLKEKGDSVQCIELYDIFPRTISGGWQPFYSVVALGNPLQDQVVLHEEQELKFLLTKPMHMGAEDTGVCQLHAISEDAVNTGFGTSSGLEATAPQEVWNEQLPSENLSTALGQKIISPNRILCDTNTYANVIVGFPDLMVVHIHFEIVILNFLL